MKGVAAATAAAAAAAAAAAGATEAATAAEKEEKETKAEENQGRPMEDTPSTEGGTNVTRRGKTKPTRKKEGKTSRTIARRGKAPTKDEENPYIHVKGDVQSDEMPESETEEQQRPTASRKTQRTQRKHGDSTESKGEQTKEAQWPTECNITTEWVKGEKTVTI